MQSTEKKDQLESLKDKINNEEFIDKNIIKLHKDLCNINKSLFMVEKEQELINNCTKVLKMKKCRSAKKFELIIKKEEKMLTIRASMEKNRKIINNKKKKDSINLERQKTKNTCIKTQRE